MKAIFKMDVDCGRMGSLEGVFIAEKEYVDVLLEEEIGVYFGEVLGKHSEVYGKIQKGEINFVTSDPSAIKVVEELKLENGFDPLCKEYCDFDSPEDYGITEEEMSEAEIVEDICKLIIKHRQ